MQLFRNADNPDTEETITDTKGNRVAVPIAFAMGVRVWSRGGNTEDGSTLKQALENMPASLQVGNAIGSQSNKPLAVLYTQIARPDTRASYSRYCYLQGGSKAQCEPNVVPTPSP